MSDNELELYFAPKTTVRQISSSSLQTFGHFNGHTYPQITGYCSLRSLAHPPTQTNTPSKKQFEGISFTHK